MFLATYDAAEEPFVCSVATFACVTVLHTKGLRYAGSLSSLEAGRIQSSSSSVSLLQMQHASALPHAPAEMTFPLAVIYVAKGMYEEAIQQFQELGDQPHALGHMGNAYARMGREAEARKTIAELQKHVQDTGVGRYEIALVYAGLGKKMKPSRGWRKLSRRATRDLPISK